MDLVWIDGEISALDGAKVALEDRGFTFADGVYEVVRAYAGKPFALDEHLARLEASAKGIRLGLPRERGALASLVRDLLLKSALREAEIYIQVTRGVARRNHLFPLNAPSTLVVWARAPKAVDANMWLRGIKLVTLPDERWARCHLKTIALLPNVLAKQAASEAGAFEAMLVRDGKLTEGSASNVFLVKDNVLITPKADHRILAGITRAHVLELAHELKIAVEERDVEAAEPLLADELFITSTSLEVLGVAQLDDRNLRGPGPLTRRLGEALAKRIGQA